MGNGAHFTKVGKYYVMQPQTNLKPLPPFHPLPAGHVTTQKLGGKNCFRWDGWQSVLIVVAIQSVFILIDKGNRRVSLFEIVRKHLIYT